MGGRGAHAPTSAMSSFSLAMLRCVRVSMYSFLVFWMNVSAPREEGRGAGRVAGSSMTGRALPLPHLGPCCSAPPSPSLPQAGT